MTKHITAEAAADINAAIDATLHHFPEADAVEEHLKVYIRRRWPFVIKSAINSKHPRGIADRRQPEKS